MRKFFFIAFLSAIFLQSKAGSLDGSDSSMTYQRVDISYILGGQVYNDNFIYNPGFQVQNTFGFKYTDQVGFGLNFGFESLNNKRFVPVCFEVIGYNRDYGNTSFIRMQAGYAIGWREGNVNQVGYSFKGGPVIEAGVGKKFFIAPNYSVLFQFSYRHQFARAEYEVYGIRKYSENLNYDMVVISLSLLRE